MQGNAEGVSSGQNPKLSCSIFCHPFNASLKSEEKNMVMCTSKKIDLLTIIRCFSLLKKSSHLTTMAFRPFGVKRSKSSKLRLFFCRIEGGNSHTNVKVKQK